jgi:repressor LexA
LPSRTSLAAFHAGGQPFPQENSPNGDIVPAIVDGDCTLKTYVVKGGRPFLKAENPIYPNLIPQELVIQGVFRALVRPARI